MKVSPKTAMVILVTLLGAFFVAMGYVWLSAKVENECVADCLSAHVHDTYDKCRWACRFRR